MFKAGTKLYDDSGFYICSLAEDREAGDDIQISNFTDWQIEKPKVGDEISPEMWQALYNVVRNHQKTNNIQSTI